MDNGSQRLLPMAAHRCPRHLPERRHGMAEQHDQRQCQPLPAHHFARSHDHAIRVQRRDWRQHIAHQRRVRHTRAKRRPLPPVHLQRPLRRRGSLAHIRSANGLRTSEAGLQHRLHLFAHLLAQRQADTGRPRHPHGARNPLRPEPQLPRQTEPRLHPATS